MSNPDYVTPGGDELYYHDLESRTEETLDECYPMFKVGYLEYEAGRVLREIDPIAFNECVQEEIHHLTEDEELDEWRENHPWLSQDEEEEVDWTEHADTLFGATLRRFTAEREDGTELIVAELATIGNEQLWCIQAFADGLRYDGQFSGTAMDAMARLETLDMDEEGESDE